MINEDIVAEVYDLTHYYCSDYCEEEREDCEGCPLDGFMVWLSTQTETDETEPVTGI